jgi:hypothetical protein
LGRRAASQNTKLPNAPFAVVFLDRAGKWQTHSRHSTRSKAASTARSLRWAGRSVRVEELENSGKVNGHEAPTIAAAEVERAGGER